MNIFTNPKVVEAIKKYDCSLISAIETIKQEYPNIGLADEHLIGFVSSFSHYTDFQKTTMLRNNLSHTISE